MASLFGGLDPAPPTRSCSGPLRHVCPIRSRFVPMSIRPASLTADVQAMAAPPPRHDPFDRPDTPGPQVETLPLPVEGEDLIEVEGEGWAVILHNDDVNEMMDVVESVMRATG